MAVLAPLAPSRVRDLRSDGERTWLTLGPGEVVEVADVPDDTTGRAVLSVVRHAAWVVLDLAGDEIVTATFASTTRLPRRHPVSSGVALHLAASGVPTYVRTAA